MTKGAMNTIVNIMNYRSTGEKNQRQYSLQGI